MNQRKRRHIKQTDKKKEYSRLYKIANADKIKEQRKEYRTNNADEIEDYNRV
ncbi:hypothetical protein UFOVP1655_124 [uncultured Caudovirales phage]|uniref:Uncharacterized protein n=1 Tax=uncultured Caudovirales phage TaxID=2100421 RepID=A0A6J5T4M7_9CAUD|nr:hypothetical protein UFOVP1655_124 [uncultured Caudovirales phage]